MSSNRMPDRERVRASAALRQDPSHPGLDIREGCIGPDAARHGGAGTVSEAAATLGVDPKALGLVISGHRGINPGLALRLEAAGWGSARVWVEMQAQYDPARERKQLSVSSPGGLVWYALNHGDMPWLPRAAYPT